MLNKITLTKKKKLALAVLAGVIGVIILTQTSFLQVNQRNGKNSNSHRSSRHLFAKY